MENSEQLKRKILIIDDEQDLCLLLRTYLTKQDFIVKTAHKLEDGLAAIKSDTPDILLLDNNLPDGLGWSMAPELAITYPKMCIHFVSAYHHHVPNMPVGACYRVTEKPISLSDLYQKLQ